MKSKISNEIWNKLILLFVAGLCLLYPGSMGSYDDTNTLKIGSSNNFPPIQFSDERSEVIGFSQELSDAVMSKLGVKYKHIHYKDKDTLFKDLKSGKIDFIQSLGYSSDRAKDMDFGTSIIGMPEVILVRKNQHNIFSLNSLYGKRVAALDSCVTHDYLKKYPGITLISVDSVADALYHLVNGDVEAFVYPKEIALYVAQNSRLMDKIKIVGKPTRRLSWSMVVRKGNKPLLDRLNAGIDKLKSSGEYDKIYQKWFGQEYFTGYTENEVKIITLFATFLSLLFGLSTGLLIYNRKVYRANNALKKSHELMDSVSRSQSDFITDRDTKLVFERMLDDILKLTESEIGFIGEVFYNRNREPYLQNHTFTDIGWGQETRELYEAVQVEGLVFRNLNSLFGAVLVTGKPVISNDPANDPRACGIPKGHPALTSFMGLPFFKKGELLGMVGIANREGGYDEGLVTYLKPFLATCSNLIEAMRVNNQRTEAESALRESKERFRQLVERSPDIVYSFSDKSGGIYYSPRLEAVLGYALEAFYNDPLLWYNQIVDEDKPIVDRAIEGYTRGNSFNIEYRIRDRFGNIHWFNDRTISIKKWQDETILEGLATDITPRKKAEEELRLSKHRLELHIKNTPLAVIEWTSDGMVRDWNPAAERIFGYSKEEILGQHWDIIVPDEAKDEIDDLWTKIVMRTGDGRSSNTNITKDGSVIQCEWYNTPLVDEQGKVMGVSSLVLDVTRRKLFEEALKSSEKKYRELLENIPQNIFYKDTQSIYISCNKNYANILKISEEDIAGKTDYDFYPKEMAESFRQDDQHVMAQDKITHIEEKYYEGDEERIAATIKTPVKDEMGKCIGVLGIFWDITEQKKTEDALRLSEQKYRQLSKEFNTLLDAIPDCILLLKPDMQIVWTNRAVTELVNKPVHELNGMSFQQFWNDWKVSDEMLPEDFTLHSGKIENIQINDSKGETLELRTFPIFDENNLLSNSIITITNITDKVKIEDEILKSQKLESIGILAGGIAHDFNNILTAISSNIGLAKLQSKPEDPFYENLQDAESVISQANRMSKQLITLARGGNPIKEVMDIKDLLQSTVEFTLRGSNVKPEFNIQLELWPVNADSGQLTQVINNMVFNARDAMADGGVLEVKAENLPENVESFLAPDVKHILISFKDYGKGISKDQQSKIFDPYYTTKSDGSGLGLSTTYSIIKKHEGLIDVISEQDIGTKFRIFLPAAGSEIPVDKSIAHKIIKGKGKILLMDDDEMVLKRTGDLLEYFGYHVIKAKNGEEAIELYKEEMETGEFFDAVILDLTVQGGMGGKKTIRRLLEINPDVRAIVVSGYSNDPILERFDEFGFRGAVAKPFSINELNEVIDRVLIAV